jgi:glycosyltransferase 2 family protein
MLRKPWVSTVAKYLLGLGVLAYVLWSHWRPKEGTPGPGLADALSGPMHLVPFAIAGACAAIGLLLTIVRWWVLARALDLPLPPREAFRLGMLGYFFNTLLPGSVGGDLFKMAAMVRTQDRRTAAVASIIFDRVIGLVGVVVLVVIVGGAYWLMGSPMFDERPALFQILRSSCVLLVVSVGVWVPLGWLPAGQADRFAGLLSRVPKVGGVAAELWRAVWTYRRQTRATAIALGLTLVNHVFGVLTFHNAAQVFAPEAADLPALKEHFLLVPVGMVVKAVFPSPGGAGGGELIYGTLYGWTDRPEALGVLGSLAVLALAWLLGMVTYLIAMSMGKPNPIRDDGSIVNVDPTTTDKKTARH